MDAVQKSVYDAVSYLLSEGHVQKNGLVVLGCSTSEIGGGHIGKSGSYDVGKAVFLGAEEACRLAGVFLAVQCCEHLNRALVLPREAALARGYTPVMAVPYPHAGGSCASAAYRLQPDPVVTESIQADAGLDIGNTLIGMHLKTVAVPLRPPMRQIGKAPLVMAFTRPKYIGGPRTHYTADDI